MAQHRLRLRLRRATVVVLTVGLALAMLAHIASRRVVDTDQTRLLEQETALSSFAIGGLVGEIQANLDSLASVAVATDADPDALERIVATPRLALFSGLGLVQAEDAGGWTAMTVKGSLRTDFDDLSSPLDARLQALEPGAFTVLGFHGTGFTRVLASAVKGAGPMPYIVYSEVPLPEGVGLGGNDDNTLEKLDFAVYIGRERPDRLVFASTDQLPLTGDRAAVQLARAEDGTPEVSMGVPVGEAAVPDGELLMVTASRGDLVGGLATQFPWLLLAALVAAVGLGAAVVEVIQRRRDSALRLVRVLERKNEDLDAALEERQEVERALRTSEARFRGFVAGSPDVLLAFDAAGETVSVLNRDDFFGHPLSSVRTTSDMRVLIHPDDLAPLRRLGEALSVADTSELAEEEFRIQDVSGDWEWVRMRCRILDHDDTGAPTRALAVLTVITAEHEASEHRQRLEEQLRQAQRLEAVGQLAGGIAHDFNNLLAVIISYAGFALDRLDGHPAAEDVEEVKEAARRAAELTSQLLTFSRRQVVEPAILDVGEIVRGTERLLQRTLGEQIDLAVTYADEVPTVEADAGEIEQVLMNLAVNARDAIGAGGGRLSIAVDSVRLGDEQTEVEPGVYARVSVSDTGSGMTREVLERAFEPFFTTKPPGEGTGMGLATVYGIARRWNGRVGLYSEPGRGTTVRLYLPAAEGDAGPAHDEPVATPRNGDHETVFVVEDEPQVRRAARRILEKGGYRVIEAESGADALDADLGAVDVLLTDVVMPGGVSGRDLAEQLQVRQPGLGVVYMSGYTADVIAHQGVLEPGVTLVEKPFSPEQLLQAVADTIDARSAAGAR